MSSHSSKSMIHWTSCSIRDTGWSTHLVYIDDIPVVGKMYEEHLKNLCLVLAELFEAACIEIQTLQVSFPTTVVSKHEIAADLRKVEAVRGYPIPVHQKSLRFFLGFASRRFVAGWPVPCLHCPARMLTSFGIQCARRHSRS